VLGRAGCTRHLSAALQVLFNKDSSRVGPKEWVQIAKVLDKNRCGAVCVWL
jgi:hypothetical protein